MGRPEDGGEGRASSPRSGHPEEGRLRRLPVALFLLATLVAPLHYNVMDPVVLPWAHARGGAWAEAVRLWRRLTYLPMEAGRLVGIGTHWRMFAPAHKIGFWLEWWAELPDGRWVHVPTPNHSPDYLARRSLLDKYLWDFKLVKIVPNSIYRDRFRRSYAHYLADRYEEATLIRPVRMRPIQFSIPIPPPGEVPGWSPLTAPDPEKYYRPDVETGWRGTR